MSEVAGKVLDASAAEHAAVRALRALRPHCSDPERVEMLKGSGPGARRSTYRLVGVGPGGSALIAKRCGIRKALIERDIYEQILPRFPVPTVRYYGFVDRPDGGWLFLEDVGSLSRYSPTVYEHRRAAGQWLGFLHTLYTGAAASARLPVLDSAYYSDRMRSALARVERLSALRAASEQEVIRTIISQVAGLETRWPDVEYACRAMPSCLTHGDFVAKNVFVDIRHGEPQLLPLDWGQAGRGPPGIDLAQSLGLCHGLSANCDLQAYVEVVRSHWIGIDLRQVQAWARLGTLLRTIVAIEWASVSAEAYGPLTWMRDYAVQLAHATRALERQWSGGTDA